MDQRGKSRRAAGWLALLPLCAHRRVPDDCGPDADHVQVERRPDVASR